MDIDAVAIEQAAQKLHVEKCGCMRGVDDNWREWARLLLIEQIPEGVRGT